MKKQICSLSILLLIILVGFSCRNSINNLDIASDLVTINSQIIETDTFTLKLSTIKVDSIATSGYSKALVGDYTEEGTFGKITAKSYFRISTPSPASIDEISEGYTFSYDSLALMMHVNYTYGDTTSDYGIQVKQLKTALNNFTLSSSLFNNSTPPQVDDTPIGTLITNVHPKTKDTLYIKLNDNLGNELLNKLAYNSGIFINQAEFSELYKGFELSSYGNNNNLIVGFDVGTSKKNNFTMRLYYHYKPTDATTKSNYVDFTLVNSELQYNTIKVDPNSTLLGKLTKATHISSTLMNGETYVQAGTGYRTKIEIPYLANMLTSGPKFKLISANLYVMTKLESDYKLNVLVPFPTSLSLYTTDDENSNFNYLKNGTFMPVATSYNNRNSYYNFNVTTWVSKIFAEYSAQTPQLVVSSPLLVDESNNAYELFDQKASSLDRLIIKNGNFQENTTRLIIMYYRY